MSDTHLDNLGLRCPDGGDFYVCDKAALNFIGCCTSNPCSDGTGKCPSRDLREASFSPDRYANIPAQSCDDGRGARVWYTCRDNDPPFLGCCASMPCGSGCPRDHLIQAVLSDNEVDRMAFLPPSTSSSPSSTPTPSGSPDTDSGSGLSTGAIVGIAVGGAALLIIIGVLIWLCRRRVRKSNAGHHPGPEMAYHDNMPNGPDPYGVRDSHMSSATTAIPHSYHSTPTSPDFPKAIAHYSHPHQQHPSQSPPPSGGHPPSIYSQYTESDNGYHAAHARHISQLSGTSDPNMALYSVSEIDGVERERHRVELPGDGVTGPPHGRRY